MLVKISEFGVRAALHVAAIGRFIAKKNPQQCRLAATVRTKDAEPLAARQRETQPLEERPVELLRQPLNVEHNIAGPPDFAEMHMRRLDERRLLDTLQSIERLAPR